MTAGHGREGADVGDVVDGDRQDDLLVVDRQADRAQLVARVAGATRGSRAGPRSTSPAGPSSRVASTTAHSSRKTNIFCPKPPPTSRAVTRIDAFGDVEVAGEEVARLVHALARADDVDLVASECPVGDDAARLHRHAQVAVLADGALDDVRGSGEGLVEIGRQRA